MHHTQLFICQRDTCECVPHLEGVWGKMFSVLVGPVKSAVRHVLPNAPSECGRLQAAPPVRVWCWCGQSHKQCTLWVKTMLFHCWKKLLLWSQKLFNGWMFNFVCVRMSNVHMERSDFVKLSAFGWGIGQAMSHTKMQWKSPLKLTMSSPMPHLNVECFLKCLRAWWAVGWCDCMVGWLFSWTSWLVPQNQFLGG